MLLPSVQGPSCDVCERPGDGKMVGGLFINFSNIQSFTGSRAYVSEPLVQLKVGDSSSSSFH